jgi:CDP-diacylglycerol---glycerol-3-phosphate 3-phosphatidyltransferase
MSATSSNPWNLPNAITAARILLVPYFIWLLFQPSGEFEIMRWFATFIFVLGISTDGIDGAIARKKGLITNLGKILDPIADKALIGGALVALSLLNEVPVWATAAILIRELGITAYRFIVIRKRVVAASGGGKLKTVSQSIVVGLIMSPIAGLLPGWFALIELALLLFVVILTIYTGLQYMVAAWRGRKDA